ncbi:MAG: hypothetical protein JEZ14_23650 [Marinilabiliaceae bacterium]|nr:hypothetical protein [Marinilabiliaceae bacterium]
MINKRKQEIEDYLKEIRFCCNGLSRALQNDRIEAEKISLESMQSTLKVITSLHKDLQKLRGT